MRGWQLIVVLLSTFAWSIVNASVLKYYTETSLITISTDPCKEVGRWVAVEYEGMGVSEGCWYNDGKKVIIKIEGKTIAVPKQEFENGV